MYYVMEEKVYIELKDDIFLHILFINYIIII